MKNIFCNFWEQSKCNITRADISMILFWIGFASILCSETFKDMYFQNILSGGVAGNIGIVLLTTKIVIDMIYEEKLKVLLFIVTLIIGAIVSARSSEEVIFRLFVVVMASNNIDYKKIVKFFTLCVCGVFIVNLFLVMCGLKQNGVMIDTKPAHRNEIRYFLGMEHPNAPMMMVANMLLCSILCFKERLSWMVISVECIIAIVVFKYTHARGGLVVFALTLILFYLGKTKIKDYIVKNRVFSIMPGIIVTTLFVLLGIMRYNRISLGYYLTNLTYRISEPIRFNDRISISLFGATSDRPGIFDCVYYRLLWYYGVFAFVLFIVFYTIAIKNNKGDYYYGTVIVSMALIGIVEKRPIMAYYSLPLLAAFALHEEANYEEIGSLNDIKKCFNYLFSGAILVLLIGHAIIQHGMEQAELNGVMYLGPKNPRITDVVFIILGAICGVIIRILYLQRKKTNCDCSTWRT